MRAIVVFNPTSGSGRAESLARRFIAALAQHGIAAESLLSMPSRGDEDRQVSISASGGLGDRTSEALTGRIAQRLVKGVARTITQGGDGANGCATNYEPCVLVAVGGDGTVRSCIGPAQSTGSTLFHLASGNENLFSRQYDWPRDPEAAAMLVADVIERHTHLGTPLARGINTMDLVSVTPSGKRRSESAAIMVSAGFDADVVAQLDARPRSIPGHMAYLAPIVRTLAGWRPPQLTLRVDGREVVTNQPGWLVVANMPQYALRLNPCQTATPDDGMLDVLFVPMQWLGDCFASLLELARGSIGLIAGARQFAARGVEVLCSSLAVQADGDHVFRSDARAPEATVASPLDAGVHRLVISVHPSPLLVLASPVALPKAGPTVRADQFTLAPAERPAAGPVSVTDAAAAAMVEVGSNGSSIHTVVPCP